MHQLIWLGNTQCHNGYEVNICKELNPNGIIVLYIRKEKNTLQTPSELLLQAYCEKARHRREGDSCPTLYKVTLRFLTSENLCLLLTTQSDPTLYLVALHFLTPNS